MTDGGSGGGGRGRGALWGLLAVALVALVVGGLVVFRDSGDSGRPSSSKASGDQLRFRPVLAVAAPGDSGAAAGWLRDREGSSYQLGAALPGELVESAKTMTDDQGQWIVKITLKAGSPGIDDFNDMAARCLAHRSGCPTGRLAFVVGREVVVAPTMQSAKFSRHGIQISGNFSERTATELVARIG